MPGLDRFKTVLRNSSGVTRFFAFLPPHGAELAPGADFFYPGDLFSVLAGHGQRKHFDALATAINTGAIEVLQTPIGVRFDVGVSPNRIKHVNISNGAVAIVDPEDGSYWGASINWPST